MEVHRMITVPAIALLAVLAFLYWRFIWFFRNPPRSVPPGDNLVSPADGTVVYVEKVKEGREVFSIKHGLVARLADITREDLGRNRILIGIFMSPFNVHYNRAPLSGTVESISRHPSSGGNLNMRAMHWRTLFRIAPYYRDSRHIIQNERTVTRIDGKYKGVPISCYVVQIAGRTVHCIESYYREGMNVNKGDIFGMIRIGSQVDVVVPCLDGMRPSVRIGDKVRAGRTVLVE